jgi:hypothetical protein
MRSNNFLPAFANSFWRFCFRFRLKHNQIRKQIEMEPSGRHLPPARASLPRLTCATGPASLKSPRRRRALALMRQNGAHHRGHGPHRHHSKTGISAAIDFLFPGDRMTTPETCRRETVSGGLDVDPRFGNRRNRPAFVFSHFRFWVSHASPRRVRNLRHGFGKLGFGKSARNILRL